MFSLLFIFASLALQAYSAPSPISCAGNKIVNPNPNGFAFPFGWTTDQPAPPMLRSDTPCVWTVTVPPGKFAKLAIRGKIGDQNSDIQVIDCNGHSSYSNEENLVPYFLPAPKFHIQLKTRYSNDDDTFAFQITWADLPTAKSNVYIDSNNVTVRTTTDLKTLHSMTADTRVAFVLIPEVPRDYSKMRSVFVFDGPSMESTYIGSLASLSQFREAYFSSGKSMTMVNVDTDSESQDLVLIQDYSNTKDYDTYIGIACDADGLCDNSAYPPELSQTVYISASNANDTIESITMEAYWGTFSVYSGVIKPSNLITTVNGDHNSLKNFLPTSFPGYIKQYVVSHDNSNLKIRRH